jgi:holo-[acyl-carrier protein] synthase
MIVGVGTDLVATARVRDILARYGDRFINRVFAVEERLKTIERPLALSQGPMEGMGPRVKPEDLYTEAAHYAKRWAAKEAVAKALGTGIRAGVYLRDIVVIKDARGAPMIDLRGGAGAVLQARAEGKRVQIYVSLSDDAGLALAFVVIEVDQAKC